MHQGRAQADAARRSKLVGSELHSIPALNAHQHIAV
jgi:hypothetical protein